MHDHVATVHEHPFAGVFTLHSKYEAAMLLDLVVNTLSEGASLSIGGARDNHHPIEEGCDWGGVKDGDVLALHIFQGIDNDVLQLGKVQGNSFLGRIEVVLGNIVCNAAWQKPRGKDPLVQGLTDLRRGDLIGRHANR